MLFDPRVPEHLVALNPSGGLAFTHPREQYFGSGERLSPQGWVVGAGFRADGPIPAGSRTGGPSPPGHTARTSVTSGT